MKKRLIYASLGNTPSLAANSMNQMKMGEGFSKTIPDFEFLTQTHFINALFDVSQHNYKDWYGLESDQFIKELYQWDTKIFGPKNKLRSFRFNKAVIKYLLKEKEKSDITLYTRSEPTAIMALEKGIETIIETHSYPGDVHFENVVKHSGNKQLLGIVTIHEVLKKAFIDRGVREELIMVAPDAVNVKAFNKTLNVDEFKKENQIPVDKFIVGYAGHLYDDRGIENIIEAAKKLPELFFLIVGGLPEDVIRRKQQAETLENIVFKGFIANAKLPNFQKVCDVLLMPYSANCPTAKWMSPMKLFEYMASKRPVIASNLDALKVHLEHEVNALLVAPDNTEELVSAIKQIHNDTLKADQLAEKAYQDVQVFTWENRAKLVLQKFLPTLS